MEEEEEEDNDEEAKAKKKTTMTPWEEHSAFISIPRFDYNAPLPSSGARTPASSSPAPSYCGTFAARESHNLGAADAKLTPKRRKVCPEELDQEVAMVLSVGI